MKFATLFSGCEGAGVGLRNAGLADTWGIEIEQKPAHIARLNGFNTLTHDVTVATWQALERPEWLHASPSCRNASVANHNSGEAEDDLKCAEAVCKAIAIFEPKYFSLENVSGYRKFNSFSIIFTALRDRGYQVVFRVLEAADYGVPQNRKRLWLMASRVSTPVLPLPTHQKASKQIDMFCTKHWVGWDEAIAHIPFEADGWNDRMESALPRRNMPRSLITGFKNIGGSFERPLTIRDVDRPSPTLMASSDRPTLLPWVTDGEQRLRLGVPHLAALQSFPADYRWGKDLTAARRAIGNAVPPLLMQKIAEANLFGSWIEKEEKEAIAL